MSSVLYESDTFRVSEVVKDSSTVIISFTSAGGAASGRMEEYRSTLEKTGASMIFVTDKKLRWFNSDDVVKVFDLLSDLVDGYRSVGVMGESMGGAGAILFSNFSSNVSRILSFSPQFSIKPPFVDFDGRYAAIGQAIEHTWPDFGSTHLVDKCCMIYGTTDWKDHVHAAMFAARSFKPMFVRDSPHEVSAYLKRCSSGDLLLQLVQKFADFAADFGPGSAQAILKEHLISQPGLGGDTTDTVIWRQKLAHPRALRRLSESVDCLSSGKSAEQSSVGQLSRGPTTAADAALGLTGPLTGDYSFHTAIEDSPWWQIDLHEPSEIHEVRLFNRMTRLELARVASHFSIECLNGKGEWDVLVSKQDNYVFGGSDGRPFIWKAAPPIVAQLLRIRLSRPGSLHLDQVRIYGRTLASS
jgi:hypothetical protein